MSTTTRTESATRHLADAMVETLSSPNEMDRNGEIANVVDGLYAIARALDRVAAALRQDQP